MKYTVASDESCWLFATCPYRNAACRVTQPEDDGCYVYRRFKEIFRKQGLLKDHGVKKEENY